MILSPLCIASQSLRTGDQDRLGVSCTHASLKSLPAPPLQVSDLLDSELKARTPKPGEGETTPVMGRRGRGKTHAELEDTLDSLNVLY
jgi:hypothetical protein